MPFFSRRKAPTLPPIYWREDPEEATRLRWDTPLPWVAVRGSVYYDGFRWCWEVSSPRDLEGSGDAPTLEAAIIAAEAAIQEMLKQIPDLAGIYQRLAVAEHEVNQFLDLQEARTETVAGASPDQSHRTDQP